MTKSENVIMGIVEREVRAQFGDCDEWTRKDASAACLAVAQAVVEEAAQRCEALMNGHGSGVCASEIRALAAQGTGGEKGR